MGTGDDGTPSKSSKPTSSPQEAPATPSYSDWSSSMQAFYGAGATPPFFASSVPSPTPHPYMWGGQHPLMPPYGTPVPYPALYPPAGVYAHPNMAAAPGTVPGTAEYDGKAAEGKDRVSGKKAKGASGNQVLVGGRSKDGGKAASGSGNDGVRRWLGMDLMLELLSSFDARVAFYAESGSEDSSDASYDDDNNDQDFSATRKGSFEQMLADGANAQNNAVPANFHTSIPGNPVVSMPATNLNIGMDLWNASPAGSGPMKLRPSPAGVSPSVAPSGMMNEQWVQDEREIKRQKRKQSNRESARRSRLRKQAECEELQQRVETLNNENRTLRDELQRLSEECEKLTSENNAIKGELTSLCGPDAVSSIENGNPGSRSQSRGDEGNR
ncbi:G-box-binding factor 1 [Dorcoceras hygrometricum]|uniref:G-box-binding factor 1 n=1 Tax=Dorcoceras hygrometricum TaxID=472368 RepID=A0A2Z7A0Q4_9LAMI|nr:G-box-binding factor 1 [Dorcoceras hygrometricum]